VDKEQPEPEVDIEHEKDVVLLLLSHHNALFVGQAIQRYQQSAQLTDEDEIHHEFCHELQQLHAQRLLCFQK